MAFNGYNPVQAGDAQQFPLKQHRFLASLSRFTGNGQSRYAPADDGNVCLNLGHGSVAA